MSEPAISRVAAGCEQLGGTDWGAIDSAEVQAGVRVAWDSGITLFDTASVYGLGRSETALATALGELRHAAVIATKCGYGWRDARDERARTFLDGSPEGIEMSAQASLTRLRIESIPLLQLHRPDPRVPIAESVGALRLLQQRGDIVAIGLSNVTIAEIAQAMSVATIFSVQLAYSLLHRDAELEIFPFCAQAGIAVLVYGAVGHGLLSGKYGPGHVFPTSDRRHRLEDFQGSSLVRNLAVAERVQIVASQRGTSAAQVAIAWTLAHQAVRSTIVGFRNAQQASSISAAMQTALTSEECAYLQADDVPGTAFPL